MGSFACVAGAAVELPTGMRSDDPVVDAVLYALTAAERAGDRQPLLDTVVADLALLGFPTGSSASTSTSVTAHEVPLSRLSAAPAFVATLAGAVQKAPRAVRDAFAGFDAAAAASSTCRAFVQVTTSGGGPAITLALLSLAPPPSDASAFPWAPATAPGTLTLRTVSLAADPAVWTPAVEQQIAQKVAAVRRSVLPFS